MAGLLCDWKLVDESLCSLASLWLNVCLVPAASQCKAQISWKAQGIRSSGQSWPPCWSLGLSLKVCSRGRERDVGTGLGAQPGQSSHSQDFTMSHFPVSLCWAGDCAAIASLQLTSARRAGRKHRAWHWAIPGPARAPSAPEMNPWLLACCSTHAPLALHRLN